MHIKLIGVLTVALLFSCQSEAENTEESSSDHTINNTLPSSDSISTTDPNSEVQNHYSAEAIQNEDDDGWGYIIYNNDKPYINQPHIPAVSGIKPFKNEDDAQKTANFALYKIEQGIMPPTITTEELDSLGVLY